MTLLTALRTTRQVLKRKDGASDLADFSRSVQRVRDRFPGYKSETALNLEKALDKVEAASQSWDWTKVKQGEVALVMQAAFSRDVEVSEAVEDFLDREAEATTNPSLLSAICQTYFSSWERGNSRTRRLARIIQSRSQYLSRNWIMLFSALPQVLDVEQGPELIAQEMVKQTDPYGWLRQSGIVAPHSGSLMKDVNFAFLRGREPRILADITRIFRWLYPSEVAPAEISWCAAAANVLLEPWLVVEPPSEVRQELLDRLVGLYGDPRNAKGGFWPLVDETRKRLVMRWLAGKSMDALLEIITTSTKNHMWAPRHDFWKGLYDQGVIDEAWIALSPAAALEAKAKHAATGDPIYTMFGDQRSKRKETCLLIMRIGNFVVVEGSHDYRVHIHSGDLVPTSLLYRRQYDAEAMTFSVNDPRARIHDAYGGWRRWVEERVLR
jgi:hypothetical protein